MFTGGVLSLGRKSQTTNPAVRTYCEEVLNNGYVTIEGLTESKASLELEGKIISKKLIIALKHFFDEGSTVLYSERRVFGNEKGRLEIYPASKSVSSGHNLQLEWTPKVVDAESVSYEFDEEDNLYVVERSMGECFRINSEGEYSEARFRPDTGTDITVRIQKQDLSTPEAAKRIKAVMEESCMHFPGTFEWAQELIQKLKDNVEIGDKKRYVYYSKVGEYWFSCNYESGKLTNFVYNDGKFGYCYSKTGKKVIESESLEARLELEGGRMSYKGPAEEATELISEMLTAMKYLLEKFGTL